MGFYLSMAGFYVANYQSRLFFLAMVFCIFLPGPVVWFLQQRFDADFDTRYGAKVTYFFRLVAVQVIIACISMFWVLTSQTPYMVLGIGVLIGFCSQAVLSSAMQFVATMHPSLTAYAASGFLAGGTIPVPIFFLVGFQPNSDLQKFGMVVMVVPAVCFVACAFLGYLHWTTTIFESTYDRLDEQSTQEVLRRNDSLGNDTGIDTVPLRLVSHEGEVPAWVWIWCAYNAVSVSMNVSLMALVAFFGDASLAQTLSLSKLFMDFIGAAVSMAIARMPCFQRGPWH